jgi:hypothetical protein
VPNAAKQQLLRLLLQQQRVRRWDGRFGDASHAGVKASGKGTLDGADVVSDAGVASSYAALTSVSDQLLKDTAKFKCRSSLVHRHRSESAYISS